MNYFLPAAKITRDQGKVFRMKDKLIVPLLHPAAALRGTGALESLRKSFSKLPAIIERYNVLVTATHAHEEPHKELDQEQERLL